ACWMTPIVRLISDSASPIATRDSSAKLMIATRRSFSSSIESRLAGPSGMGVAGDRGSGKRQRHDSSPLAQVILDVARLLHEEAHVLFGAFEEPAEHLH